MVRSRALAAKPIESQIFLARGQKVLLDADLAALYGVEVRVLNQAVKRNRSRFPLDFVFRLTAKDLPNLRSQSVISSWSHGGRRYLPYVFTEHGAIMAANLLNSTRAVEVSIFVVRAFVRLRETLTAHKAFSAKLAELEQRLNEHDASIEDIIHVIRSLTRPQHRPARQIGFRPETVPGPKMLKAGRA
jgi:hypothetical protein